MVNRIVTVPKQNCVGDGLQRFDDTESCNAVEKRSDGSLRAAAEAALPLPRHSSPTRIRSSHAACRGSPSQAVGHAVPTWLHRGNAQGVPLVHAVQVSVATDCVALS